MLECSGPPTASLPTETLTSTFFSLPYLTLRMFQHPVESVEIHTTEKHDQTAQREKRRKFRRQHETQETKGKVKTEEKEEKMGKEKNK